MLARIEDPAHVHDKATLEIMCELVRNVLTGKEHRALDLRGDVMHALHRQLRVYGHERMAREQAAQKRHDGERGLARVHDDRRLVGHVIEQGPRDTAGTVPETGVADIIDAVSVVRDGIGCLVRRPHDGVKKLIGHSNLRFSTHDAPSQSCVPTNGQTIRVRCAKGMQGDKRTRIDTECTEAPAPYLSR